VTLGLTIVEEGDGLDPLAHTVTDIHPALSKVAGGLEVPSTEVTVILTTNLRSSVRSRSDHADFEVERIAGGRVTGKTLPVVPDYSTVNLFLDASRYLEAADGSGLAEAVYLLAHEYGHVLHGRLRHAVASAPVRWVPAGMARLFVTQAVEELRCDMLADVVLRCTTRLRDDSGELGPAATAWDLLHDSHTVSLGHVLDDMVHPGWPDPGGFVPVRRD
jgi:hypothetical protein